MSKIVSTVITTPWALNPIVIETDTNLERLQSRLVMATKGYVPHNKMMWGLAKIMHLDQGDAHWLALIFAESEHGVEMRLERTTYGHYFISSGDRSGIDELPELKAVQFGTQIIDGVRLCEEIIAALTDDNWHSRLLVGEYSGGMGVMLPCPDCDGVGLDKADENPCARCGGDGFLYPV